MCCGQDRKASNAGTANAAAAQAGGPVLPSAVFEYVGDRMLTAVGQGTGFEYRFTGRGARFTVDGRDRASMARIPVLREVKPAR